MKNNSKLSQKDIAAILSIDTKTLYNWRKRKPSLYEIVMLGFKFKELLQAQRQYCQDLENIEAEVIRKARARIGSSDYFAHSNLEHSSTSEQASQDTSIKAHSIKTHFSKADRLDSNKTDLPPPPPQRFGSHQVKARFLG